MYNVLLYTGKITFKSLLKRQLNAPFRDSAHIVFLFVTNIVFSFTFLAAAALERIYLLGDFLSFKQHLCETYLSLVPLLTDFRGVLGVD